MGTMITLALGRLEVDWGKNDLFMDHGALYQQSDIKPVPTYYAGPDWPDGEPIVEMHEGLGKPLGKVVSRLELLGYTLAAVEHRYNERRVLDGLNDEEPITFHKLKAAIKNVDVSRVSGSYANTYDLGEFVRAEILERLGLESNLHDYYFDNKRPDHWQIDLLLQNFDPYDGLRLLAENPKNLTLDVNWDFTPLVEAGWAKREAFCPRPTPNQRFLLVTEGRSDARILEHAFGLTRDHIADFFQFVDMEDGYPFSGTGNLFRFAQGLASINIQNNIVILYDNDAEGVSRLRATQELSLPPTMRAICLPDLNAFTEMNTIGPTGNSRENINGKAAAIECYLDLNCPGLPGPIIKWVAFNEHANAYQGRLHRKKVYETRFLQQRAHSSDYDTSKIEAVLGAVIKTCISIAEKRLISGSVRGRM